MSWQTLARSSPGAFACVASGGKLQYPHHWRLIDKALLRVANGDCRRLIINIPPQFGKSELVSKHFPAWYLGEHPDRKIILTSYEASYAALWGMKSRELYREYSREIWGAGINDLKATTDWWFTSRDGYMATAGALSAVTGKGAHVLIIDDPHKSASEAHSDTMREKVWDNYISTFLTRLQPNGSIILIQTRWHSNDLTGRLLEREGDQWEKIILPALNEKDESLFPQRYSSDELMGRRASMGSYAFNALYQQNPTPPEGNIFKRQWWRYWTTLPEFDRVIQSWDLTFSSEGSSHVVGLVVGKKGADSYVIAMERGKWGFPDQVRRIKSMHQLYPQTSEILIEEKANGAAAIATLRNEVHGIIPIVPKESKEARAAAVSFVCESGNIFLPQDAPWLDIFRDECSAFPNGTSDDMVDSLTQALNRLYLQGKIDFGSERIY